jgi:hypothetical protein
VTQFFEWAPLLVLAATIFSGNAWSKEPAEPDAPTGQAVGASHMGLFGGFGLGVSEGNFSVDSEDGGADTGAVFGAHIGYAFANGFGVGAGLARNVYAYRVRILEQDVADVSLSFTALDFSGYYFAQLTPSLELGFRAGLSKTSASLELGALDASEQDSTGVHASVDLDWFFGSSASLMTQLYFRSHGVGFENIDKGTELSSSGLLVGVRWR